MRLVTVLLIGAAAGAALTYLGSGAAPAGRPVSPGTDTGREAIHSALEEELDRLRAEKLRLEVELERTRRSAGRDDSAPPAGRGRPPGAPEPPSAGELRSLQERAARARRALVVLESDPELARFHERHSREENGFPRWSSRRFLADPAINPARVELGEEESHEFERLYARAFLRMRSLDLESRLIMTDAALYCVEEQLAGGTAGQPGLPPAEAHFVHVPADLTLVLPRAEYPEVEVLQDEMQAAVVDWFHEARDFMARLRQ